MYIYDRKSKKKEIIIDFSADQRISGYAWGAIL